MDKSKETKRNMNIPKKNPEKKTAATSAQVPTEAPVGNASAAGKGANRGEGILNAKEEKRIRRTVRRRKEGRIAGRTF